jgi:hypothetical protein
LTECGRAAAHEKSAREPGREPETFHDSDELTNFAVAAQQNVREGHCGENPVTLTSLASTKRGRKTTEDFY